MKITIDDSMKTLKKYLEQKGYQVYALSENILSDIYIYSSQNHHQNILMNSSIPDESGCLIIDADNKSLNEIEYIIKHRVYSPLF